MNIRGRPFLFATGVTFAIIFVLGLINLGITAAMPTTIPTTPIDPNDPFAGMEGLGAASLISCLVSICTWGMYVAGGALYAYFHNREVPVEIQDGALGGAAVVIVAGALGSIIGSVLSFLVTPDQISAAMGTVPPEFAGVMGASVTIGVIFGLCCAVVIGGLLGAVGGAIGASIFNR